MKKKFLPTKHLRVHMNSFKCVRAFQIELDRIWKCWFFRRGENWRTRRKTSRSKGENQQQRVMGSWQQTRSSTHIWRRRRDLNPGHIAGRRVLSLLRHPCPRQTLSWLRWKPKWAIKGHSIVPVFRPKRKTIPFGAAHTYTVYHIGEYIPLGTLAGCPYRHLLTGLGWNVSCIRTSE